MMKTSFVHMFRAHGSPNQLASYLAFTHIRCSTRLMIVAASTAARMILFFCTLYSFTPVLVIKQKQRNSYPDFSCAVKLFKTNNKRETSKNKVSLRNELVI